MSELISINPENGSLVGTYPEHTSKEINKIISDVNSSFNYWKEIELLLVDLAVATGKFEDATINGNKAEGDSTNGQSDE